MLKSKKILIVNSDLYDRYRFNWGAERKASGWQARLFILGVSITGKNI